MSRDESVGESDSTASKSDQVKGKPDVWKMSAKETIGRISRDERLEILEHELDERVKELACLHGISRLAERVDISREELLQGIVDLIPSALQYPEIACARMTLEEEEVRTDNFIETEWKLAEDVILKERKIGSIEVYYLEERAENEEGPFQMEERALIFTVCEYLARIIGRIRNEEELRRSEKKYSALVENTTDGIIILQNGKIRFANIASLDLAGYHPEEMVGNNFLDFVAPGSRELVMKRYAARIIGKEVPPIYEMSILKKDGSEVPVEVNAGLIVYEDGPADLVFIRDITARKRADETLKEIKDSLAEAQRIAHLGSWDWDIVNNELRWSDEIYRIFGLELNEFGATYGEFMDCIHPDDRKDVQNAVDEAVFKKKPYAIDHRIVRPDGEERIVHEEGKVSFDSEGKRPVRMIGIVQDVTDRRKADLARKESEERFRRILESSPDPITVTDLEGNIIECNQAMLTTFGFSSKAEAIGLNALEYISPESQEEALEHMMNALEQGHVRNVEYVSLTKDGKRIQTEVSASVIPDANGNPMSIVAITKDITERKKAEETLSEKMQELERYKEVTVGRELKMIELKERIKDLESAIAEA